MSFFAALIAVSAAAGAALLLAPDENTPSGRILYLFASLAVLSVALSPVWTARSRVASLISSFEEFIESSAGDADSSHAVESAVAKELSNAVTARVCERFSLSGDRVKVDVTLDVTDAASPVLESLRVSIIAGEGTPDPDEVKEFLRGLCDVPNEVVILAPYERKGG